MRRRLSASAFFAFSSGFLLLIGVFQLALGLLSVPLGILGLSAGGIWSIFPEKNWEIHVDSSAEVVGYVEISVSDVELLPRPIRSLMFRLDTEPISSLFVHLNLNSAESSQMVTFLQNTGTYEHHRGWNPTGLVSFGGLFYEIGLSPPPI